MAGSDEEEQAAGTYAQTGAGAPGAAAGAAAGGVSSGVGQPMDVGAGFSRDKAPPPSYDGSNPEVSFRQYEKSVRLWQWETDIPLKKQAAKLLRALSGNARLAVEEMEFDEIATEDGVKNLMGRLRDFFTPHLEVALPRAFEAAVYGQSRQARETFAEYVSRMERSFIQLAKEGVDLPSGAKGYIVYRQASLSENQEQRVQTWCEGSYEQKEVLKALRKLDKVLKEKPGKGHYLNQINEDSEYVFHQEIVEGTGLDEDEDDQYIWIAEGDLDEIMPEEQVQEALASYKEVRNALRDQRNNRGFYPKGNGKFGNSFGGKGKGKRRVHQEELKMRTRCHNCGQVGHWKDECSNPSRKAGSSGGSTSSTSSSARTGFLVMGGNPKMESTEFWLKEFVKGRTAKGSCGSGASDSTEEEQYRSGGTCDRDGTQFCGTAIRAEEGIVDTAAEAGLVGLFAYERLEKELQKFGLKPKWTEKQATAKGVGGEANAVGVVLIPLGIGKIDGILEATVVREDVPPLLPVSLIKMLKACLDFDKFTFTIPDHEIVLPMHEMKSGHVTIGITEFSEGPFHVPPQAGHIDEFTHVHPSAMLVQCEQRDQKFERPRVDLHSFLQHGGLAQPREDAGATTCSYGSGRCDHGFAGGQTEEGHSKLESGARQDCHYPCHGGLARSYRRMVAGFITFGIFYRGDWQHSGGLLCGDHQDWKTAASAEIEEGFSNYGSVRLRAPKEHVGNGWQCGDVLRSLQSVPRKMGESISSKGCEGRVQEGGFLEPEADSGGSSHDGTKKLPYKFGSWSYPKGKGPDDVGRGGNPAREPQKPGDHGCDASHSTYGGPTCQRTTSFIEPKCLSDGGDASDGARDEADDAAHEGEGYPAGGSGAHDGKPSSEESDAKESVTRSGVGLRNVQRCSSSIACESKEQDGEVPLWGASREADSEEGGTPPRKAFLEVRAASMPVLRMGSRGGGSEDSPAKEEEPKERTGISSDIELLDTPWVSDIDPNQYWKNHID